MFCVVRAVPKFGSRLVINPKTLRFTVIEIHVFDTIYMFSLDRRRECWDFSDAVQALE